MSRESMAKTKRESIVEKIGIYTIKDPYRWLEKNTSEVEAWASTQHENTVEHLAALSVRKSIQLRLKQLIDIEFFSTPVPRGDFYFYRERLTKQALPVLYVEQSLNGHRHILIDQNKLSDDHSTVIGDSYLSNDGSLLAYRLSKQGCSQMSLQVMNVHTGETLKDVIPSELNPVAHSWPSQNEIAWLHDNSGFYYSRSPLFVPQNEKRYHQKLYFHRLGDHYSHDLLVFGERLNKEQIPCPQLSNNDQYLLVVVLNLSNDTPVSEIYLCDLANQNQKFIPVITEIKALFNVKIHRNKLYVATNHHAPFWHLLSLELTDIAKGMIKFETVIAQGQHLMGQWAVVGDYIFVETIENVSSRLKLYDLSGLFIKQINLPDIGCIETINAEREGKQLFFSFSSCLISPRVYCFELKTLECRVYRQSDSPFDASLFEIKQCWYESTDKSKIPMFLIHRKGIERKGNNPTVIHGYGGFNLNIMPSFNAHIIPFLEQGGLYVIVNIRGGGEFGEAWHQAGMRINKQNVFDDFIAAGEWLIKLGYTRCQRLGCFGWSNGGLLVNVVAEQRPDLWQAVVSGAAVTDMVRFHLSDSGRHWIADYGSPEELNDLNFLLEYSPYHNMPKTIDAPAILFIVPDKDDRVACWHGYKMFAQWQAANSSDNPILLRGEKNSGHKGGISVESTITRFTDIWTFFFWRFKL